MNKGGFRHSMRFVLSFFLLTNVFCCAAFASRAGKSKPAARSIEGIVYFTNNSPDDYTFLVELFDAKRRRVAVKWSEAHGLFEFKNLKPGKYYLQVSGSNICLLQYEVDARREQPERLRVFGDADCGKAKVNGLPKPRPTPRDEQR